MQNISRRKFLSISGIALCLSMIPTNLLASNEKFVWKGAVLGADATMTLFHENQSYAKETIKTCIKEIRRLERIFSLFHTDSSINQLNQNSILKNPPVELVDILNISNKISQNSEGAFDITVQPLWTLYKTHFAKKSNSLNGPSLHDIKKVKELISWERVKVSNKEILLTKKNMQITLNGIAQGYITDKIAQILKQKGFTNVLLDLGEIRAIGQHPNSRDWNISTPYVKDKDYIKLNNMALASSGGYGTRFNQNFHHLFNPHDGKSANFVNSVTVKAPNATLADALSTAIYVMPKTNSKNLLNLYPNTKAFIS